MEQSNCYSVKRHRDLCSGDGMEKSFSGFQTLGRETVRIHSDQLHTGRGHTISNSPIDLSCLLRGERGAGINGPLQPNR